MVRHFSAWGAVRETGLSPTPDENRRAASPHATFMSGKNVLARVLAQAFLAEGPWTLAGLTARGAQTFGEEVRWVRSVARATLRRYAARTDVEARELARFVWRSRAVAAAPLWDAPVHVERVLGAVVAMRAPRWPVPSLWVSAT